MKRVLVTGSTGFIGQNICELLGQRDYRVRGAVRSASSISPPAAERVTVGDIGLRTDWKAALDGIELVVHCAGLAHITGEQSGLSTRFIECNSDGTLTLLKACEAAGVRRFVFLSSIKVNGEETVSSVFSRRAEPNPRDAYASSKLHAEMHVRYMASKSAMQAAIIRPPLVYGPGVRANFLRLMNWVDRRIPLPLATVQNSRSFVNVWNLCDLVERLLHDEELRNPLFMVSDGEDVSTSDLILRLGCAMERPVRMFRFPTAALRAMSVLSGRRAEFERLCGSLSVDISETCSDLDWRPSVSLDEGLARTARWYFSRRASK